MAAAKLGPTRRPAASSKRAKGRAIDPKAKPTRTVRKHADSGEPRAGSITPKPASSPGHNLDPAADPRAFPDAVFDDTGEAKTSDVERGSTRRSR